MMLSIITFGVKIKQFFRNYLIFLSFFVVYSPKPVVFCGNMPMLTPQLMPKIR